MALADVYDALSSERAYKKAFSHEKSLEMILCGECGAFNPLLLQCLTDIAENLQEQLKISSLSKQNQRKPQTGSEDVLRYSETASPEQAMRLLKQERAKHQFFSSISREIQFEMTARPEILTLSAWGAEQLGLGEVTLNPFSNAKIRGIFGEDTLQTLDKLLAETTPGKPMVEYDCILQFKRKSYRCRIIARSMWSEDLPPQNTGTIGKIIEMEEIHL